LTNFLLSPTCLLRSSRSSWGISTLTFGIRIASCRFFYIYWSF
jgi:hypothetical protein